MVSGFLNPENDLDDHSLAPTITCRSCGEIKPVTEFDTRSDTGKQHRLCKPCRRAYQRSRLESRNPVVSRPRRLVGSGDLFTCTRCHRSLPADAFPRRLKNSLLLQSWCRSCFAAYNSQRYHADPERPKARARRNRELRSSAREAEARAALIGRACTDCGNTSSDLSYDPPIGRSALDGPWSTVQQIITTRGVLCAACRLLRSVPKRPVRAERERTMPFQPINATCELRPCARCGAERPLAEFTAKYREHPQPGSYCRNCQKEYHREWYSENRDAVLSRMKHYRSDPTDHVRKLAFLVARRRRWEYLSTHACVDCGESDPVVLEFDHRADKKASIMALMRRHARWDVIMEEIAKCDVRCANCHRRRTAKARMYYRELSTLQEERRSIGEEWPRYCEPGGTRTPDFHVRSVALYPLSYRLSRTDSTRDATSRTG